MTQVVKYQRVVKNAPDFWGVSFHSFLSPRICGTLLLLSVVEVTRCGDVFDLELGLQGFGTRHFLVCVQGVAGGFHPGREEEAAFLGLDVVCKRAVAFFRQAFLALGVNVAVIACFVFAVGEETAVSRRVLRNVPAHLAASVERTESAARNHHVELAAGDIVADVRCHHDESLAGEHFVILLGFVLAFTGEGEGEAFSACGVVTRSCRERVGELVAYDNGGLARAGGALAAGAEAAEIVADGGLALGVASLCRTAVFGPGAVRHAAVPVAGSPASLAAGAGIQVLGFFGGNVGVRLRA